MRKNKYICAIMAAAMALTMTACNVEEPISSGNSGAPVNSSATTSATTTTFAENQGVNDAVANISDNVDNSDLEINKRIKWMGHYDIDETSAAAILFKNTYGIPETGEDPNSEGRIFEYYSVAFGERYDKLGAAIASGNSPDLFPFDTNDYPYGVLKGRYQPIDELIDFDSPKWANMKELMDLYKLNGRYYCAFWEISLYNVMFYRQSMIDEIGVEDPRDMFYEGKWDWDAFLDIARIWKDSREGRYVVDGYNLENEFVIASGVPLVGIDGNKLVQNFYDPNIERAEELLLTLYREDLRYPRHELNAWNVNPKAWADGDVLFYADGALWVFENTLNKYAIKNGWSDDEIKLVPFPKDPQADKHYVTLKQDSFMWVKGSQNKDGVKAWIDCCAAAAMDDGVKEASIEQAVENFGWNRDNLDFYYSLTTLDGSSPLTPIVEFKGGLGSVSDGSGVNNPIQSLTNLPYLTGDSFVQLRETHLPAIQAAIDDINEAIAIN